MLPAVARGLPGRTGMEDMKGGPKGSEVMSAELLQALVIWLVIGAIAGWLAGQIMTGGGFGLIGNIVVGIIGAVIAGWLFPYLWLPFGNAFVAAVVNALIGSIILLFVIGLLKRA